MLLPLLLSEPRPGQPFVLGQSTAAQSIFPFLRALCNRPRTHSVVHTFLYAPSSLVDQNASATRVYDWSAEVPGYGRPLDPKIELLSTVKNAPRDKNLNIVIDSLETLSENLASPVETYELLHDMLQFVKNHPRPSQLIVHSVKPSETAPFLLQTNFSSSLIHLTAHPTSLFHYLSKEFLISPPPVTADVKFWSIFIPFSERTHEIERLSFGPRGEGSGSGSEFIIEILARGINNHSRKWGTGRVLEGWDSNKNLPCSISDLQDLKLLFSQKPVTKAAPDPTQNLPFNLSLSESQQQSRAQVPLPYAYEGQQTSTGPTNTGAIFYDPDSADDIDDDDPDDDLDI